MTLIIVTHELNFARDISDRIIIMDEGVIIEEGSPEQLFSNPKNERTRSFLRSIVDREKTASEKIMNNKIS